MKCTRRTFLATSTVAMFSGRVSASTSGVAFLVLRDIPAAWKPADLTAIFESLRRSDLRAIVVSPDFFEASSDESAAERFFFESIYEDLLEIVAVAPTILLKNRYWHLRAANDFRRATSQSRAGAVSLNMPLPVTYFEYATGPGSDLSAYRSAGFRVRIVCPEADSPTELIYSGRDQLSISGGRLIDLLDPGLDSALNALPGGKDFTVLHLSLANGANLAGDALLRAANASAGKISACLVRLGAYPSLARDFFLSGGEYVPRDIALLLDGPDADGSIASFARDLSALALPFSRMTSASIPGDCATAGDSLFAECITASDVPLTVETAATVIVGPDEVNGLGPDARMHFGLLSPGAAGRLDRLTLAESDRVMHIRGPDVVNPLARARLARRLKDGQDLGHVRLHDIPGLRDRVMASDPVLQRYWSLRRRRLSDPALIGPDAAEQARLMDDAALAWSYFDRHIYPETGLVAGTVSAAPGGRVNSEVTLWDVGSQINAVTAAADLGLIDKSVAADMIVKAVAALPTNGLGDSRLPPSNFSAQTLKTTIAGFDSCDTGRLGIALARAVSRGLIEKADALATLKDWDLDRAVNTGRHFSNTLGKWRDTSQSHCTDYIVSGFAFFGQEIHALQDWLEPNAETEIGTLYRTASLGAVATEPFALKAIEIGMDGPTQLILDALFDAQLGWYENTGQLRCVSETPIDREPWFLYSGLKLDIAGPDAWVIGSVAGGTAPVSLDPAREILSSKAAYLWKAVHPHPYCDRLVEAIREQAKIRGHGFSVGVYSDTLRPVPDYTDINTNGIILTAIAHLLGQR
jgi:hypothetical protein